MRVRGLRQARQRIRREVRSVLVLMGCRRDHVPNSAGCGGRAAGLKEFGVRFAEDEGWFCEVGSVCGRARMFRITT